MQNAHVMSRSQAGCILPLPANTDMLSLCRGLEKALDQYAQPSSAAPASEVDPAADGDQKAREAKRSSARESRKKAMKNLSVPERDVLLVLGAICKVCCRFRYLLATVRVSQMF